MLVEAAHRLNIKTIILDTPNSPAKQINGLHAHIDGSFTDADSIRKLAEECDILTIEIEHVDTTILEELEASGKVEASLNPSESMKGGMRIILAHGIPGRSNLRGKRFVLSKTNLARKNISYPTA